MAQSKPGLKPNPSSEWPEPFVAAAVQAPPSIGDLATGVDRAVDHIRSAAKEGARLIVFPETWLPGYPYFHGYPRDPGFRDLYDSLFVNSVTVPGPQIDRIAAAAKRAKATVVIGVNERDEQGGTLYNTLVYIGANGKLLGKHRKLVPTLSERLIWGRGDGSDLDVYDSDVGRLGGLICYEHQMAPARYALAGLGAQIHASVWPGYDFLHPIVDAATRHLSYENACFVVVAREVMSPDRLPPGTPLAEEPIWDMHGGSAIIAPGGKYLAGPVFDEETTVYAEIDLRSTIESKRWVDSVGHYARPDVFQLQWDKSPKQPLLIHDGSGASA
ncbi:MAG: carbon-nitrogen hydrolase family protein [Chloroflexi bacterium]|nr:carbon-nitrogen hydrolase family protein [Chloroflexota bacterium]MCZ6706668.1 carbon-nitrogen hydrolase family protein [Chloroflexota bacterium]